MPFMATRPDSPIDQQRLLVAEIRARLEREELILEGMERMVAFVPKAVPVHQKRRVSETAPASRGRQPGAISKRWRAVFDSLVQSGNHFDEDAVIGVVRRLEGRDMRRSEVRRLFETHQGNDIIAVHDDGKYSVTDSAISKFGLGRNDEGPPVETGGPSIGSVAERSIASDSNSDGAGPEKAAPVGSNPTTSAHFTGHHVGSAQPMASTSPPNSPWPAQKGG